MIGADLARAAALLSVPLAAATGLLTYSQLCLVAVVQAAGAIVFNAASGAHLKALVGPADRASANGRFEATFWTALSAGPPLGGALTSALGVSWTITVDAASFLLSALGVHSLRSPEPAPPTRTVRPAPPIPAVELPSTATVDPPLRADPDARPRAAENDARPRAAENEAPPRAGDKGSLPPPGAAASGRLGEIAAGWRYIAAHRDLRALFINSQVFGAAMMAASPLLAVLMLRDLHFPAWQYGVAWGVPCLGGVAGALALKPLTRHWGERPVLLASGVGRAIWLCPLAFIPAGVTGLLIVIAVELFALFGSGVFNPAFATYRMTATEDGVLSRVLACWSISSRTVQPLGILLGGVVASVAGVRVALFVCGLAALVSAAFLPWRAPAEVGAGPPRPMSV
jgi:MFS family permease